MRIGRKEALVMVKIIALHEQHDHQHYAGLLDLSNRLESFLVSDEDDEEGTDEEAEDDLDDEEDATEEEDEEDDEDEGEGDESPEEGDEKACVDSGALRDLNPVTIVDGQQLTFVVNMRGTVNLCLDGATQLCNITQVQRHGKALHVLSDNIWSIFTVDRFPVGWARTLPLHESLEVTP